MKECVSFFLPLLDPRIEIPADAEFTLTERRSHFSGPLKQQTHQFHPVNDFICPKPPGSLTDSRDSSCRSLVQQSSAKQNLKNCAPCQWREEGDKNIQLI